MPREKTPTGAAARGNPKTLDAAQGAPRDPRRDSRGERSPWHPLETRPDSQGVAGLSRTPQVVGGSLGADGSQKVPPISWGQRPVQKMGQA